MSGDNMALIGLSACCPSINVLGSRPGHGVMDVNTNGWVGVAWVYGSLDIGTGKFGLVYRWK